MDIQTALISLAIFAISAGILIFIAMFGMKEKSYEEALAEQRQQANALLGTHIRTKPKEKKTKKANKKSKEKQTVTIESEVVEESEDTESPSSSTSSATPAHQKLHVEFKEPTVIEEAISENHQAIIKKRGKKDKVRSILIHKLVENHVIIQQTEAPPANHFEQLHPKDEFELLHSHIKEETEVKVDQKEKLLKKQSENELKDKKNKPSKVPLEVPKEKQTPSNSKKPTKQVAATKIEEPVLEPVNIPLQSNGIVNIKEKKKKKAENNVLQQLTGAKEGDVNISLLLNAVRKAELSRSEVQILIDLLLNKQHEAPEKLDEWSEGKADPIQKLKKQLAEKEKALLEEQEALLGAQAKLKEIRTEKTAERLQLQQRTKSLEEALHAKHLELQSLNNLLHSQGQKMQQIQAQINDEGIVVRKLREENAALQLQRQQIDLHIAQAQEGEATIQELQSRNNQLTLELHSLNEQNLASKEHQQTLIVQLQHQVNRFKNELEEKDNFGRQFEELSRDLEQRLSLALRQENESKVEITQLKTACQQHTEEIRRLELNKAQLFEDCMSFKDQKESFQHTINELKAEKSELQVMNVNGLAQENQIHKAELLNLDNELSSVKSELQFVQSKYSADMNASKNMVKQLQTELDEQKTKNNELRKKNWKVMDALKAAESKTLVIHKEPTNMEEILLRIRSEEQDSQKKFIQRLFPDIPIPSNLQHEDFVTYVEEAIQKYVSNLEKSKSENQTEVVTKLQAQIQHYKTIIDDTEGFLKKLQNHIEQEEVHWRKEIKTKDTENQTLQQKLLEVTTKLDQIQTNLKSEQEQKSKLQAEYELVTNKVALQNTNTTNKLTEEINRLTEKLLVEQRNSSEFLKQNESENVCFKEMNSNVTNGSSITEAKQ